MKQKKKQPNEFTAAEIQRIKHLREPPEMRVQVQSILDIVRHAAGPMKTADEVEELLVAAMRRLGNVTLGQWAIQAEERVRHELQRQDPTVRRRKKTLTWGCVFGLVTVRERIGRSRTQSYGRPLPPRLGVTPRGRARRLERGRTDFGSEQAFAGRREVCGSIMDLSLGPAPGAPPR